MTKSEAFLAQSMSDMHVFDMLFLRGGVDDCHIVHYLQMFTEKLAKAAIYSVSGNMKRSHIALTKLPKIMATRRFAEKLGYQNRFDQYQAHLKRIAPFCLAIERSCPAVASLAEDMPNTEYPWLPQNSAKWIAPCDFSQTIINDIRGKADARQCVSFLRTLVDRFHENF